ncbi:hypothetical protein CYMTET_51479, partial [Cymbomonas tetramitiformis]|eukprot:gene3389-4265_t
MQEPSSEEFTYSEFNGRLGKAFAGLPGASESTWTVSNTALFRRGTPVADESSDDEPEPPAEGLADGEEGSTVKWEDDLDCLEDDLDQTEEQQQKNLSRCIGRCDALDHEEELDDNDEFALGEVPGSRSGGRQGTRGSLFETLQDLDKQMEVLPENIWEQRCKRRERNNLARRAQLDPASKRMAPPPARPPAEKRRRVADTEGSATEGELKAESSPKPSRASVWSRLGVPVANGASAAMPAEPAPTGPAEGAHGASQGLGRGEHRNRAHPGRGRQERDHRPAHVRRNPNAWTCYTLDEPLTVGYGWLCPRVNLVVGSAEDRHHSFVEEALLHGRAHGAVPICSEQPSKHGKLGCK